MRLTTLIGLVGRPAEPDHVLAALGAANVSTASADAVFKFYLESGNLGHGWAVDLYRWVREQHPAVSQEELEHRVLAMFREDVPASLRAANKAHLEGGGMLGRLAPDPGETLSAITGTGGSIWGVRPDGSLIQVTCRPVAEDGKEDATLPVAVHVCGRLLAAVVRPADHTQKWSGADDETWEHEYAGSAPAYSWADGRVKPIGVRPKGWAACPRHLNAPKVLEDVQHFADEHAEKIRGQETEETIKNLLRRRVR